MAPSRRFGSNSSPTRRRSLPSSPRNASRVRGRRPSPSAKLARSCCSSASAARAFVCSRRSVRRANSVRTTSVVRLTPALQMVIQADAQRTLDQPRPLIGGAVSDEGGQLRVVELEMLDDDAVRLEGYAASAYPLVSASTSMRSWRARPSTRLLTPGCANASHERRRIPATEWIGRRARCDTDRPPSAAHCSSSSP